MRLLRWFYEKIIPSEERNFLIGDLDELYEITSAEKGKFYAALWYVFQIIISVPHFLKNRIYWG